MHRFDAAIVAVLALLAAWWVWRHWRQRAGAEGPG
jgi:heme A synthase